MNSSATDVQNLERRCEELVREVRQGNVKYQQLTAEWGSLAARCEELVREVQQANRTVAVADAATTAKPRSLDLPHGLRLGFLHIPKSAGTSVTAILRQNFGGKLKYFWSNDFAINSDQVNRAPVLAGHIPYYLFNADAPMRRLYTILRNPEARAISTYRYILSTPDHFAHPYVTSKELTLAQCFDHAFLRFEFANLQTRMLGWTNKDPITFPVRNQTHYASFCSAYADYYYCEADSGMLDTAIERLSKTVSYGILEERGSVLRVLCAMVGGDPGEILSENITPDVRYTVTDDDRSAIRQNNLLDQKLYDFALRHHKRIHHGVGTEP